MVVVRGDFVILALVRQQAAKWFDIQGRWFFHFLLLSLLRFLSIIRRSWNESKFSARSLLLNFGRVSLSLMFILSFHSSFFSDYPKSKALQREEKIAVKCRHGIDDVFRFHFRFTSCGRNIKHNHIMKLFPFSSLKFPSTIRCVCNGKTFCFSVLIVVYSIFFFTPNFFLHPFRGKFRALRLREWKTGFWFINEI